MPSLERERQLRDTMAEKLASGNDVLVKEAEADMNKFIRRSFKEQSFMDQIIEPTQLQVGDFYPHLTSDKLWVMLEIEPDYPGAVSMAYNTPSPIMTFGANRTLVSVDRISSYRMKKEVNELLTWSISLRDIQADFQLKEILTMFDTRGIAAVNTAVGTVPGQVMAASGAVQYHRIQDGLTPNALGESLKYIPRLGHRDNGLNSKTMLFNSVTHKEFAKWAPFDAGQDFTSRILKNGLQEIDSGVLGLRFVQTIKRGLVPDGATYHFGDPNFIGRSFVWKEPTVIVRQNDHTVEFSVFTERGGAIFLGNGLARADYVGV